VAWREFKGPNDGGIDRRSKGAAIHTARMAADNRSCVICTPAIHGGRQITAPA
jgi:hypothetical protein